MTGDGQRLEIIRKDVDTYSYAKVQIHVDIAVGYCRELLSFYDALAREMEELKAQMWRKRPDDDGEGGETWQAFAADLDMQRMERERQLAEAQQRCEKLLSERQAWLDALARKDSQLAYAERLLAQQTESASLDRLDAPAMPQGQIGHGTLPAASPYKNDPAILETLRTAQQRCESLEKELSECRQKLGVKS